MSIRELRSCELCELTTRAPRTVWKRRVQHPPPLPADQYTRRPQLIADNRIAEAGNGFNIRPYRKRCLPLRDLAWQE